MKKLQKQEKGFTIIEVLIVLAIAGLILLIVFLAVPALQRNSRNTQRQNDVSKVLGAVQEVLNNNGGQTTSITTANVQAALGTSLGYYQVANVTVAPVGQPAGNNTDLLRIHVTAACNNNAVQAGTTRQIASTFAVEGASGSVARCQSS